MLLYFAYGSNMHLKQMQERCRGARVIGTACLYDWQFFITTRGTANIRQAKGKIVYGVLWQVTLQHISWLDYFEGRSWKNYHRHVFNLERYQSPSSNKNETPAHVYVSSRSYPGKARTVYMRNAVLPGAKHFNLPKNYIEELASWLPNYELGAAGRRYYGRKTPIHRKKRLIV